MMPSIPPSLVSWVRVASAPRLVRLDRTDTVQVGDRPVPAVDPLVLTRRDQNRALILGQLEQLGRPLHDHPAAADLAVREHAQRRRHVLLPRRCLHHSSPRNARAWSEAKRSLSAASASWTPARWPSTSFTPGGELVLLFRSEGILMSGSLSRALEIFGMDGGTTESAPDRGACARMHHECLKCCRCRRVSSGRNRKIMIRKRSVVAEPHPQPRRPRPTLGCSCAVINMSPGRTSRRSNIAGSPRYAVVLLFAETPIRYCSTSRTPTHLTSPTAPRSLDLHHYTISQTSIAEANHFRISDPFKKHLVEDRTGSERRDGRGLGGAWRGGRRPCRGCRRCGAARGGVEGDGPCLEVGLPDVRLRSRPRRQRLQLAPLGEDGSRTGSGGPRPRPRCRTQSPDEVAMAVPAMPNLPMEPYIAMKDRSSGNNRWLNCSQRQQAFVTLEFATAPSLRSAME